MSKLPGRQQKGNRLPEHRRDRVPLAQGPTSRDRKELVRAQKCPPGDPFPMPWAWYRGDDLTGYSEDEAVTSWHDRAGGAGDIEASGNLWFSGDIVGGRPGAYCTGGAVDVSGFSMGLAGYVIALVVAGSGSAGLAKSATDSPASLLWVDDGWQELDAPSTWIGSTEPMPGSHLALALFDGAASSIWLDNALVAGPEVDELSEPFGYFNIGAGDFAEILVWNRQLSVVELGEVWAYVQDRYGL